MPTRVQVLREVSLGQPDDWRLCFQGCRYVYDDGDLQEGFRFIWRRPDGSLQAAWGQACIPSLEAARRLLDMAQSQGWDDLFERRNNDRPGAAQV